MTAPDLTPEQREELIRWDRTPDAMAEPLETMVARMVAEAEQRGREDNADHGMCYVSGSKALEARDAEMRAEGYEQWKREVLARAEETASPDDLADLSARRDALADKIRAEGDRQGAARVAAAVEAESQRTRRRTMGKNVEIRYGVDIALESIRGALAEAEEST